MEASGKRFGYETLVVTDANTDIDNVWLRLGDCREEGLMMWLLRAQAEAIKESPNDRCILISPDTLIAKPLDFLFGKYDLSILTRRKPKPIVNSVIAYKPSEKLNSLWFDIVEQAKTLSQESKEWGADIDAVVNRLRIRPMEYGRRYVDGVHVNFIPINSAFESIRIQNTVKALKVPIWDFKGARKSKMTEYARLLNVDI